MSHRGGRLRLIGIRLLVQQQGGSAGNKRRAKRSSPSRGVGAKGIGCDNGFARSGNPNNRIAIVGKRRPRILVARRRYSHHIVLPLGRVNSKGRSCLAFVPGRRRANDVVLVGVVQRLPQFPRPRLGVKAHVDYVSVVLYSVIDGPQNVGEKTGTVRFEGFQGQELRRGSDQVDHAHHHSTVAKRGVLVVPI